MFLRSISTFSVLKDVRGDAVILWYCSVVGRQDYPHTYVQKGGRCPIPKNIQVQVG